MAIESFYDQSKNRSQPGPRKRVIAKYRQVIDEEKAAAAIFYME